MSLFGAIADHYVASGGSHAYRDAVLADSPLAYYRMDDASGTTMADASGHSRSGTYSGSPTLGTTGLLTGDTDTAVAFDAVDDTAVVTYDASWMVPASFTVEAIVKASSLSGQRAIANRWEAGSGSRPWAVDVNSGKLRLFTSAGDVVSGATTLVTGTTYHVVAVYDSTGHTGKVYVNGVVDASATFGALATNAVPLRIGAINAGSLGSFWAGILDEVAFYGTALSGTRIAAHAALV